MTFYKPANSIEKKHSIEIFIELLSIFLIVSVIAFLAPGIIHGRNNSLAKDDPFYSLIDYFYNKHHFYPFVALAGLIGTIIYSIYQKKNQRIVAFHFEDNSITLTCRNSLPGKLSECTILKTNFKVLKIHTLYRSLRFKIYNKEKYCCTFYPKSAPWNAINNRQTVNQIIDIITENQPDSTKILDHNIQFKSKFDREALSVIVLFLYFIIMLFSFMNDIVLIYFIFFISLCLLIEYIVLQSIVTGTFTINEIHLFWFFRFKKREIKLKYSEISRTSYSPSAIRIYYTNENGKTKNIECRFDKDEIYFQILKIIQSNGVVIEFRGIDKEQERFILNQLEFIEL